MPAHWLSQWVESWRCMNSQHSKKLCLSLLMLENLKPKKVNKSFVPGPRVIKCFVFFGFLCIWTFYEHYECFPYQYEYVRIHIHILVVFLDLYVTFVPAMVGSIMIVGEPTHYALLHYICDMEAAQMNVQHILIRKLMLYEFDLDYNAVETIKNICGWKV